uniref:Gamma-glutamyl transferase n=1 Tax=Leersia perrieri TaxID=77586 RepID=A0A0D9UWS4_9ORYZ
MYASNPSSKYDGALAMGIPGELAGLHAAWSRYGKLPWSSLFSPAIKLARDGFTVAPTVASALRRSERAVLADPGLRAVFAPEGRILAAGELCRNPALADTLEAVSVDGVAAFYDGEVGERFVADVRRAGGVATVEDLRNYKVEVSDAMRADAMGYTFLGMPPPSSGAVGMALILNILGGYESVEYLKGYLGVHRFIEAVKHMLAVRMDLGDPDYINVAGNVAEMLSPAFADKIRQRIVDNTTFPPGYYFPKWSQLRDHGTSHLCVVDGDRNAVAMTTTVNYLFGAHVMSPSTGVVLNNEMDDFSVPAERTPDKLPPAPANFIAPGKRPLSSMTPSIILKNGQLAGVVGGSGGTNIIGAVTQVFLNHFVVGMNPLAAVQHPRVYHKLVPNVVVYENETVIDGEVIELSGEAREFLQRRGHRLNSTESGAVCQFIVQDLLAPVGGGNGGAGGENVFHGMLTAVSDPRKGGSPAGL